jgi:hypothetical protein
MQYRWFWPYGSPHEPMTQRVICPHRFTRALHLSNRGRWSAADGASRLKA